MPTVEKTSGGRVYVRGIGRFTVGDTADVSESEAAYLVEERADFERVGLTQQDRDDDGEASITDEGSGDAEDGSGDTGGEEDGGSGPDDGEGYLRDEPPATQIDEGVCPWCSPDERYEGEAVGQHAASAHPDEWAEYKANRED